jgi:hypothetical protein
LEKREAEIINRVMDFLDTVFGDRMEFWNSGNAGGWHPRGKEPVALRPDTRRYVWSGPLSGL